MAGDDIVTRLRDYHATVSEAPPYYRELTQAAADEIERLRAERDEARRRVCEDAIRNGRVYRRVGSDTVRCETSKEVAEMMGWDCFKENTND